MSIVRDPATLEIGQLKFSGCDFIKDLGQSDFGRVQMLHENLSGWTCGSRQSVA